MRFTTGSALIMLLVAGILCFAFTRVWWLAFFRSTLLPLGLQFRVRHGGLFYPLWGVESGAETGR